MWRVTTSPTRAREGAGHGARQTQKEIGARESGSGGDRQGSRHRPGRSEAGRPLVPTPKPGGWGIWSLPTTDANAAAGSSQRGKGLLGVTPERALAFVEEWALHPHILWPL